MTQANLVQWCVEVSAVATNVAANVLVQTTVVLVGGLVAARLLRRRGAAVQSAALPTLIAAVACPAASWLLGSLRVPGGRIRLPYPLSIDVTAVPVVADPATGPSSNAERTLAGAANVPTDESFPGDAPGIEGDHRPRRIHTANADDAPPASAFAADGPAKASLPDARSVGPATPPKVGRSIATVRFNTSAIAYIIVTSSWFIVGALFAGRLVVAHLILRSARRQARPASAEALARCEAAATALAIPPPPPALLVTPQVSAPCLVGWRRPAILLPPDAEPAGRDVLLHELAHLRRGDCLWSLLARIAAAVLWFQPLLWVLVRRSDQAADDVCDDHVVTHGGDRAAYARQLVDIAERLQPSWPAAQAGVGVMPFKSSVGRRVARILDSSRALSTRTGRPAGMLVLALAVGGTLGAGVLGTAGRQVDGRTQKAGTPVAMAPSPEVPDRAHAPADAGTSEFLRARGIVLDPAGKPLAGATVRASPGQWMEGDRMVARPPLAQVRSGPNGRFDISFPKLTRSPFETSFTEPWRDSMIVASADGYGIAWDRWDYSDAAGDLVLKLVADQPVEGHIVDPEGRSVSGVVVKARSLADAVVLGQPQGVTAEGRRRGLLNFPLAAMGLNAPVTTDAQGNFRIAGLGRERNLSISFESNRVDIGPVRLNTRVMDPVVRRFSSGGQEQERTYYGAKVELSGTWARSVIGTVRDAGTHRPLAGVNVVEDDRLMPSAASMVTNADGRFKLVGLRKRKNTLLFAPREDQPYVVQRIDIPDEPSGALVSMDIDMHRGVWVTGKVTDLATGNPVPSLVHYDPFLSNPVAAALPEYQRSVTLGSAYAVQGKCLTRADGTFRTVAVPGRGIVAVEWMKAPSPVRPDDYIKGFGADQITERGDAPIGFHTFDQTLEPQKVWAVKEINVSQGAADVSVDFQIVRRDTTDVVIPFVISAVDPDGKPIAATERLYVKGATRMNSTGVLVSARGTAGETRVVAIFDTERKLGKVIAIRPADVPVTSGPRRITVRLEPLAVITGRLLNSGEDPAANCVVLGTIKDPIPADFGFVNGTRTGPDGRFTLLLPTGAQYTFASSVGDLVGDGNRPLRLTVEASSTPDLGDVCPQREGGTSRPPS